MVSGTSLRMIGRPLLRPRKFITHKGNIFVSCETGDLLLDLDLMELLTLSLLGPVQISLGGKPLTGFTTTKALALLVYLAVTPGVHSRDALANLLWSDRPDQQAKKNLRNALPNLRTLVGSHLMITRHSVAFNRSSPYRLDVEVFRSHLLSPQSAARSALLQEATTLYRGDFLKDFYVRDAPTFEEWALIEREHLRTLAIDGLQTLAARCIEQHDYELGLATTKRLLALDAWRETAHQQHMVLLASSGQRNAALAQYAVCRTILAEELGVEPMADTTALYEQIKAGGLPSYQVLKPAPQAPVHRVGPQVDWSGFPKWTALYGRHAELAQLHQWLTDGVSLVGIFGVGGQGKTALATHLAWSLTESGPYGGDSNGAPPSDFEYIIWRSLSHASPFTTLLQEWLTFLSDHQVTQVPNHIDEQCALLFDYLRQQRCLLILDDVECILHDGVFRPGYEAYGQMLHQVAYCVHRSCVVLVSREQPKACSSQDINTPAVRCLQLRGVSPDVGVQLLHMWELSERPDALKDMIARYAGHPLALRLAATTVREFFGGDPEAFLACEPPLFDDVRYILDQQCATLSPLAKRIMRELAMRPQGMSFQALRDVLGDSLPKHDLLQALRALKRRSLLETYDQGFGLQDLVAEYVASEA